MLVALIAIVWLALVALCWAACAMAARADAARGENVHREAGLPRAQAAQDTGALSAPFARGRPDRLPAS